MTDTDTDEVVLPFERSICGHDVFLVIDGYSDPVFRVTIAEGNDIEKPSFRELKKTVDAYYERLSKRKKKKMDPIPLLKWTNDIDEIQGQRKRKYGSPKADEYTLIESVCTGFHGNSGNPIIKVGDSPAQQESSSWARTFLRPMKADNVMKLMGLYRAYEDAKKAFEDFKEKYEIDNLKEWLKKRAKCPD